MQSLFVILAALLSGTSSSPIPIPIPVPDDIQVGFTLRPTYTSQYQTWTGARTFDTDMGLISKPNGQSTDITTLVTFTFPDWTEGHSCSFHFNLLDYPASLTTAGTAQFDLFTSLQPADMVSTTDWPNGNLRDQYLGRMQAYKPGEAMPVEGFTDVTQPMPCPAGYSIGAELVGVGDFDLISWDVEEEGPYFSVCLDVRDSSSVTVMI